MNCPLISIIVPVYNVEIYLEKCIYSILSQTYKNIEIILVDDGSTDNSRRIIDNLKLLDKRIVAIHQENKGVTAARYTGFLVSKGDFLTFVDGDDKLPSNAIEILYNAIEPNIDIIIGNSDHSDYQSHLLNIYEYRKNCINGRFFPVALWAHLYKRSLFNQDIFNLPREIKMGEDLIMNLRLSFNTLNNVKIISEVVYYYTYNPQSLMQTFKPSLDYELRFYSYLINSIPQNSLNIYIENIIHIEIITLLDYIYSVRKIYDYRKHPFFKKIQTEIRTYKYNKISMIEKKIIFSDYYSEFIVFSYIYIVIRKIRYFINLINKMIYKWKKFLLS